MKTPRKTYDDSFKLQVVKMITDQKLTVTKVHQATGVSKTAIQRWLDAHKTKPFEAGQNRGLSTDQLRIRQLEQENALLKQDINILKKASAFFARELK
jgi:transposase